MGPMLGWVSPATDIYLVIFLFLEWVPSFFLSRSTMPYQLIVLLFKLGKVWEDFRERE